MDKEQLTPDNKWNAGTWIILMLVLLAGSFISYYLKDFTESLLLYLPTSLAIIMVHWFGPRILPLAFINGFVTLVLWNAQGGWGRILLLATREPVVVFASWFLCRDLVNRYQGLSNIKVFSRFILLGIFVPDLVNSCYTYNYSFIGGDLEKVTLLWLSDFITIFTIAVPLLHYFSPRQTKLAFRLVPNDAQSFTEIKYNAMAEIALITLLYLMLGFIISFDKYWFIYGISATFVALRHGFCYVIFINVIIFLFNYILPFVDFGTWDYAASTATQSLNVHLGMSTMFLGSALIGRVISDLRNSEESIIEQKKQLETSNAQLRKANLELDRFVYSVSHDISAPLKSIKGLLSISRLENTKGEIPYIDKIEESVKKLEDFSEEILQHSRASRKEIITEEILLEPFIREIIDNLRYLDSNGRVEFECHYEASRVVADRFLLKVAFSNLISNAIKFQNTSVGVLPKVSIRTYSDSDFLFIEVKDNGLGIEDEYKDRIFEMFYRASEAASGSGLGLFIAKEAALKLGGDISVQTKNGEGSTFTIRLPLIAN